MAGFFDPIYFDKVYFDVGGSIVPQPSYEGGGVPFDFREQELLAERRLRNGNNAVIALLFSI